MLLTEKALVLAGGGVAGIAWETGFLLGLQDEEASFTTPLLARSTTLIGTSAGATVAAQIATRNTLGSLFERQVSATTAELNATIDMTRLVSETGSRCTNGLYVALGHGPGLGSKKIDGR